MKHYSEKIEISTTGLKKEEIDNIHAWLKEKGYLKSEKSEF